MDSNSYRYQVEVKVKGGKIYNFGYRTLAKAEAQLDSFELRNPFPAPIVSTKLIIAVG